MNIEPRRSKRSLPHLHHVVFHSQVHQALIVLVKPLHCPLPSKTQKALRAPLQVTPTRMRLSLSIKDNRPSWWCSCGNGSDTLRNKKWWMMNTEDRIGQAENPEALWKRPRIDGPMNPLTCYVNQWHKNLYMCFDATNSFNQKMSQISQNLFTLLGSIYNLFLHTRCS